MINLIDKIKLIPDEFRSYQVRANQVLPIFGVNDLLITQLMELGLPYEHDNDLFLYDSLDMQNVALNLRLPSMQRMSMKYWRETLEEIDRRKDASVSIQVRRHDSRTRRQCPASYPSSTNDEFKPYKRFVPHILNYRIPPSVPQSISATLVSILETISQLEFFALPRELAKTTVFSRSTGLANCIAASQLLIEECTLVGINARVVWGLFLSTPFAFRHTWTEVLVNGTWIPFDPLMLKLLKQHADLDVQRWPTTRSMESILLPLGIGYDDPSDENKSDSFLFITTIQS